MQGRKRARDRERDRGGRERERERDREIETEKTLQKFMEFYLVMLHFAEWSKAQQWIVA